ncbi:Anaphase-promoting complex (APC), subunit 11 [Handroanthus impetiginosus]|uniref:Anaphase-promoting complex (APC), subunit 11 n=1 Tax=Handroanthus impetiginosus TaxID=429701 RepID=A0A2G9H5G5_9LAMI|nr:Anaphase-promoting complex (APC), subunit 11 [Handroanthus impetiginosus]
MICIYAESYICTLSFIFYTCIWIPLSQVIQAILTLFNFLLNLHNHLEDALFEETPVYEMDLPVSRFQDLEFSNKKKNREESMDDEDEMCSICLMEFEKEDMVNKLPICGHLFHMDCLEKWLDRCQFTCPLCRSMLLHSTSSKHRISASDCILPPVDAF